MPELLTHITSIAKKPLKLFFQDEARFGRISQQVACWSPQGRRPIVPSQIVREYTYVYGAVCPQTGEHVSLILPTMETVCFNLFLEEMSRCNPDHHVVLITDGAASHRSKELVLPEHMTLMSLPPYSPELNPQENVWKEIRKEGGFYNRVFKSMNEVEEALVKVLQAFSNRFTALKRLTTYPWLKNCPTFL